MIELARAEAQASDAKGALDRYVQARTIFHALTFNAEVPKTEAEQKRKRPPPGSDSRIRKYQKFRDEHDPAWMKAQQHPVSFYRFLGLNDATLVEVFGEPPSELEVRRSHKTQAVEHEPGKLLETLGDRWATAFGMK